MAPSMQISKISLTGEVTVKFSDPFVVRTDLSILKAQIKINAQGDTEPNFQLIIVPNID